MSRDRRNRLRWRRADVLRARADEPVVGGLLEHVRAPADRAARCERGCEQLARDAAAVHDDARVELDVGVEAPVDVRPRAVNVDALNPWSIVEMRYFSTAAACSAVGTVACIM